jgi:hypothetical protein
VPLARAAWGVVVIALSRIQKVVVVRSPVPA